MKLKNLTPHPINLIPTPGLDFVIKPEAVPARCIETRQSLGEIDYAQWEIEIDSPTFGEIVDLPDPIEDVGYVVSFPVASAAWKLGRTDVFTTSIPIRDDSGKIIGCQKLAGNPSETYKPGRESLIPGFKCGFCGGQMKENSPAYPCCTECGAS